MPPAQKLLAAAIIAAAAGSIYALLPPNPSKATAPEIGDTLHFFGSTTIVRLILAPYGLVALHTALLAYFHPAIPAAILRHSRENGLDTSLITWTAATSVPLTLMLCVGIPMRLVSYASLGKNFTFALAEPDHLVTDGIYRYLQHPGYTTLLLLPLCITFLFLQPNGALACWVSPRWHPTFRKVCLWLLAPLWISCLVFGIAKRIEQEENMMRATYGAEWERWHATTARLIPWIL